LERVSPCLPLSLSFLLLRADLDFVVLDADIERIDAEARVVGPFSVADAESPGMPRTSHDPFFVEITGAERRAHVWAKVVDREILAVAKEDGNKSLTDLERATLPFGNRADFSHGYEVVGGWIYGGHAKSVVLSLRDRKLRLAKPDVCTKHQWAVPMLPAKIIDSLRMEQAHLWPRPVLVA
jgi:hypothetical protein